MNIETANRLVQYRKQRGMSQEDLATALGISRQAISKWERAEASPDTDNLIALAKLYGISLDELLMNPSKPESTAPETAASAAAVLFQEPPAAPVVTYATVSESDLQTVTQEPELPDAVQRPPLSPAAKFVMMMLALAAVVGALFVLRLVAFIFPGIYDLYPILCTVVYLILGFSFGKWHPGWLIFLSIPIFEAFF